MGTGDRAGGARHRSSSLLCGILLLASACSPAPSSAPAGHLLNVCSSPKTAVAAPARITVGRVTVQLPDATAKITWEDGPSVIPTGGNFIVHAEGKGVIDPAAYKAVPQVPMYEYLVSSSGSIVASRHDWQIDESGMDGSVFVLAGPGARWALIDNRGEERQLNMSWDFLPLLRDIQGRIWAFGRNSDKLSLVELDSTGSSPQTVEYGGNQIKSYSGSCDGGLWIVTDGGVLNRVTANGFSKLADNLPVDTTPIGVWPASDGTVWLIEYLTSPPPDNFSTGEVRVSRFSVGGMVGTPLTVSDPDFISIVGGPDGALWGLGTGVLYRIGLDGRVRTYSVPERAAAAPGLETSQDGRLVYVCGSRTLCFVNVPVA